MEWPYPEYYSDNSIIKELRQITKVNEPLNVMSAIYIVLYSTYHLVKSMKSNIYYQLLLILFITNGVSSALAHMTNNPVCIYIDGLTFIIACSLANYSLYQNDLVKLLIIINLMIYIEDQFYYLDFYPMNKLNQIIFRTDNYSNMYTLLNIVTFFISIYFKNSRINLRYIYLLIVSLLFRSLDSISYPFFHSLWHITGVIAFNNILISNKLNLIQIKD